MSFLLNWLFFIEVIYFIYECEGKCTQYYVLLKGNNFKDYKPIFIDDINWTSYNTSKEYDFFKQNRDCFVDLQCLNTDSFQCTKREKEFSKYITIQENFTEEIETTTFKDNTSDPYKENEDLSVKYFAKQGDVKDSAQDNWKTVGIVVVSVGLISLASYIVAKELRHLLQQRHYYLQDSHVAESGPAHLEAD